MLDRRPNVPRQLPLLTLAVVSTFVVTFGAARSHGPEIVRYGDCPNPGGQRLPYRIQTPVPGSPRSSISPAPPQVPQGPQSYCYNVDGVTDSRSPPSGLNCERLPVSVQHPILPPSAAAVPTPYNDPLRGRSYGIGIQPTYDGPQNTPSRGLYDFGVQTSVPGPKRPNSADPSAPYDDPYRVQIQPGANPNQGPALWGPLPIAGIERPPESRNGPGQFAPAGPGPRLTGLTSTIDKLLLPADCPLPMDGQGNGPSGGGGYPGGNGPYGGGGYPLGTGPLGADGNGPFGPGGNGPFGPGGNGPFGSGGNGPFGGGRNGPFGAGGAGGSGPFGAGGNGPFGAGGNGPAGGAGYPGSSRSGGAVYPGGNGPFGGAGSPGGNGPLGGPGYSGGNGPFEGAGNPGGHGTSGRGGSCSCRYS